MISYPLQFSRLAARHGRSVRLAFLSAGVGLALLSLGAPQASARNRRNVKPAEYKRYFDEIQSVNASEHTVTIATMFNEVRADGRPVTHTDAHHHNKKTTAGAQEKSAVTLKVIDSTEIEVGGQKRDFSALSKGMKVDVTKGTDDATAARLVVTQ